MQLSTVIFLVTAVEFVFSCTTDQFRCNNGRCISKTWLCYSELDCDDGEDEQVDPCPVIPSAENCMTSIGIDYNGTLSVTPRGRTCQSWSSNTPHSHRYHHYDGNYCRNTDGDEPMPWCYTTDPDVRWEFCDVPPCKVPKSTECKMTVKATEYQGTFNVTGYGFSCQNWSSQTPHKHNYGNYDGNFCRNTRGDEPLPWCYTTDPAVRWQFCAIPLCDTTLTTRSTEQLQPSSDTFQEDTITEEQRKSTVNNNNLDIGNIFSSLFSGASSSVGHDFLGWACLFLFYNSLFGGFI